MWAEDDDGDFVNLDHAVSLEIREGREGWFIAVRFIEQSYNVALAGAWASKKKAQEALRNLLFPQE